MWRWGASAVGFIKNVCRASSSRDAVGNAIISSYLSYTHTHSMLSVNNIFRPFLWPRFITDLISDRIWPDLTCQSSVSKAWKTFVHCTHFWRRFFSYSFVLFRTSREALMSVVAAIMGALPTWHEYKKRNSISDPHDERRRSQRARTHIHTRENQKPPKKNQK